MVRPTLYLHGHKALRSAISTVALHAGATRYADDAAVKAIVTEWRDVARILRSHAKNEQQHIHPLIAKIDAPLAEIERTHVVVDEKIDDLFARAEQIVASPAGSPERQAAGLALYRGLNAFNAFYIEHMRDEEERFLPLLLDAYSPDVIRTTREQVHAGIPLEEMLIFVRYQLPALNADERVDTMLKYKKQWGHAEFEALCTEARSVLSVDAWADLARQVCGDADGRDSSARLERVLTYWFGDEPDDPNIIRTRGPFWFAGPQYRAPIDAQVRKQFLDDYERACRGEFAGWCESARGRLALIILLDQFSRNFYRDDPRAFAQDSRSLYILLEGLERGQDRDLRCIERMFFYMPLMHAETLDMQKRSVALFTQLVQDASEAARPGFQRVLGKAHEHLRCIELFGRYPHRNKTMGRPTTSEEQHFLDNEPQPGQGSPGVPPPHLLAGTPA